MNLIKNPWRVSAGETKSCANTFICSKKLDGIVVADALQRITDYVRLNIVGSASFTKIDDHFLHWTACSCATLSTIGLSYSACNSLNIALALGEGFATAFGLMALDGTPLANGQYTHLAADGTLDANHQYETLPGFQSSGINIKFSPRTLFWRAMRGNPQNMSQYWASQPTTVIQREEKAWNVLAYNWAPEAMRTAARP
ncbi:uncharacterized protein DNG_02234 [Cephalotrichum gorgonifer]|uniref:Uncharacterized protein n=1 Tax=Cephalotrichum gorgonifer TaxID=2041049 RepID=A0AAE8SSC6_9PEZI|nr:uncharacterized protein DNG_02234 [Cephalotrichum gorgonifer]